jgi:glycosyltransferase involved in cell wall biosynthesis
MTPSETPGNTSAFLCIDTTLLHFAGHLRGIPQVLFIILETLSEPEFKGRVRFLAFEGANEKMLRDRGVRAEEIVIVPQIPVLGRWERFYPMFSTWRYRKAARGAAALIHPEPRTMTRLKVPQVVVWYDFLQIDPAWKPWKKPSRYLFTKYRYHLAMRRARGITISAFTKREALEIFPDVDPHRLTPLLLGIRKKLEPTSTPTGGPLSLPLRCMYVGAYESRKNIFALLENLDRIFGDIPFRLDLAGRISAEERARAEELIAASKYRDHIFLHGLVSDQMLLELIEACEITLFPSLGEGFGLPVAEAMMRGHVVFAFNNTSIPEVGGDGIVLAENNDFAAWGRALARLTANPSDAVELRARAMKRAEYFSEASMKSRYRAYFLELLAKPESR